jgi:hypothetical protein
VDPDAPNLEPARVLRDERARRRDDSAAPALELALLEHVPLELRGQRRPELRPGAAQPELIPQSSLASDASDASEPESDWHSIFGQPPTEQDCTWLQSVQQTWGEVQLVLPHGTTAASAAHSISGQPFPQLGIPQLLQHCSSLAHVTPPHTGPLLPQATATTMPTTATTRKNAPMPQSYEIRVDAEWIVDRSRLVTHEHAATYLRDRGSIADEGSQAGALLAFLVLAPWSCPDTIVRAPNVTAR